MGVRGTGWWGCGGGAAVPGRGGHHHQDLRWPGAGPACQPGACSAWWQRSPRPGRFSLAGGAVGVVGAWASRDSQEVNSSTRQPPPCGVSMIRSSTSWRATQSPAPRGRPGSGSRRGRAAGAGVQHLDDDLVEIGPQLDPDRRCAVHDRVGGDLVDGEDEALDGVGGHAVAERPWPCPPGPAGTVTSSSPPTRRVSTGGRPRGPRHPRQRGRPGSRRRQVVRARHAAGAVLAAGASRVRWRAPRAEWCGRRRCTAHGTGTCRGPRSRLTRSAPRQPAPRGSRPAGPCR